MSCCQELPKYIFISDIARQDMFVPKSLLQKTSGHGVKRSIAGIFSMGGLFVFSIHIVDADWKNVLDFAPAML